MSIISRVSIVLLLVLAGAKLTAQERSTAGTDFWFGFMQNLDGSLESSLEIFITAAQPANGTIAVPGQGLINFQVLPGETFKYEVASERNNPYAASGSERIENKGIHITADADVSVFAFNRRFRSADASIILPTPALGSQYYVASYFEHAPSNDIYGDRFSDSELLVVGVEDNTRIRIKPTVRTLGGRQAGRFFEITLDQGEVYQVKAQGDLSGTLIETVAAQDECNGQKFAVFGGNQWTRVSDDTCYNAATSEFGQIGGAFAGDHLFEQMLPVTTWGRDFTVLPFETRDGGYLVRMTASRPNTVITVNGSEEVVLAEPGDFETINTNEPLGLSANFPIQVAQFSKSLSCDLPFDEFGPGDPFMLMVSPNEQTFRQITFNALASDVIDRYFLNVITPTEEVGGVLLNGNSVSSEFSPFVPNPDISVAVIEVVKGQDITLTSSDERGFIAYVYGFGPIESFGYVAGSGLSNIDLQIIANDLAIGEVAPFACVDSPLEFFADFNEENSRLTQFDNFQWDFGDGTTATGKDNFHTYGRTGTYNVSLYASGGQGDCFIEKTVTKEIQVTEVVLNDILGETSICLNVDSFDYTVDGDLGNAFQWEVQGGMIIGDNDNSVVTIDWDPSAPVHTVSVTATNAPGCTKSAALSVFMNSAEPLDRAIVFEDVLCHGTGTGLARINITGGTAPYTVSWNGGDAPANVQNTGLAKGSYGVQVSDANGK
ncbi:MAG: PKD domain-containing protein [Roseivirga sp.]|nr:PKD domain-containing protein [Roseivirga sp.]